MTKSIHTLIPDIYALIGGPNGITNLPSDLGVNVQDAVAKSLGPQDRRGLRLSGLGDKCPSQLWYSIRHPELAQPLPPYAKIKYCYGHIIEHLLIGLAKAAGHDVTGEQDELNLDGIRGHRDCVIDGCIVDVKSASTLSFQKFRDKTISESDDFGYLDQLDGYAVASLDDPLVTEKEKAYLLVVDKQLGHLCLYEHRIRKNGIISRIAEAKAIVGRVSPPNCTCQSIKDGESGNFKLDVKASYNPYKYCCNPLIRTFLYAGGPRYLSTVCRRPARKDGSLIPEVDRYGELVYN